MSAEQHYSASEAARALGLSLDTLRRWDRDGRIRTERDAAIRRLVPRSEIERLRAQQRAISEVLRAVARSEGLQPVLDEIVEAATSLCAGDNGRFFMLQGDRLHATANFGLAEE